MTRLKPRRLDKLLGMFSAVHEKFSTNEDPKDNNIGELEEQMDSQMLNGVETLGPSNQKGFAKTKKSYKHLR